MRSACGRRMDDGIRKPRGRTGNRGSRRPPGEKRPAHLAARVAAAIPPLVAAAVMAMNWRLGGGVASGDRRIPMRNACLPVHEPAAMPVHSTSDHERPGGQGAGQRVPADRHHHDVWPIVPNSRLTPPLPDSTDLLLAWTGGLSPDRAPTPPKASPGAIQPSRTRHRLARSRDRAKTISEQYQPRSFAHTGPERKETMRPAPDTDAATRHARWLDAGHGTSFRLAHPTQVPSSPASGIVNSGQYGRFSRLAAPNDTNRAASAYVSRCSAIFGQPSRCIVARKEHRNAAWDASSQG